MRADVVVVGAGLAGMTAALAAEQDGADVILVDRGPIAMGTNSALSNGAFSGPVSPERTEEYVELVARIGKGLNRLGYLRQVAREAPAAVEFLCSLGLEIAKTPGQWVVRSARPETIPGITLVQGVARQVLARNRIRVERGVYVSTLLQASGRIVGVRGHDLRGEEREVRGGSTILACGGAGAIYAKHDNQQTILGQGYRLAGEAGLDLWDMEFVQFYPIVLDEPGLPAVMIYPPYPAEARLITATGEDLLDKHGLGDINQAIIRQRDAFSALIAEELRAGPVRMDLRPVPAARWKVHSLSLLARFGFDFATRPVRITPATHFCMGGVRTDTSGHTAVPGLFACGEMVWGLHGANRMGGNALMECLVSGRVAGRAAALLAVTNAGEGGGPLPQKPATPATDTTPVDLRALRQRIREVAWRSAGIVRTGEGMAQGLAEVEVIREALANAGADTAKERALREDLRSAAFTLCAILTASIGRLESRGCFKRADHPVEDDAAWRRNSRLSWDPLTERFSLEYRPAEAG